MKVQFFAPMLPPTATHQEKKWTVINGKPVSYDSDKVKAARMKLSSAIGPHRPAQPMEGAVRLLVKWCFPVKGRHCDGEYRTSRPDTDNLQKLLKDVMTENGFWRDDAQQDAINSDPYRAAFLQGTTPATEGGEPLETTTNNQTKWD